MVRDLTVEEWRQEDVDDLGKELGSQFFALCTEVVYLRYRWQQYKELFESPRRVELLDEAASLFFRLVKDSFLEGTLLGLRRISDFEKMGSKENLTLRRLPGLVRPGVARDKLQALVDHALERTKFAKPWRDQLLAHLDLDRATEEGVKALEPIEVEDVDRAFGAVEETLKFLGQLYRDRDMVFGEVSGSKAHGAVALLYVLRNGLESEAAEREAGERGQGAAADCRPRPV